MCTTRGNRNRPVLISGSGGSCAVGWGMALFFRAVLYFSQPSCGLCVVQVVVRTHVSPDPDRQSTKYAQPGGRFCGSARDIVLLRRGSFAYSERSFAHRHVDLPLQQLSPPIRCTLPVQCHPASRCSRCD